MEFKFCKIIFFRCTLFWHKAAGSFHFQPFQLNWNWWHSLIDQTMISIFTYLLSPCYASWHIGQRQVSSTLLCCWLFFLLCPRCILFPLFHFRWCASMFFFGLPLFLFPSGVHLRATFVMSSDGLRRTWPSHLHLFWISKVSMSLDLVFVMLCRSLLEILFGQNIFIIFLRLVLWKLESLLMSLSVILQHSEPYRHTDSIQLL